MNIPTPADPVMEMARKCAAETKVGVAARDILSGEWDDSPVVQSALAAIRATTEAAAVLADVISSIHIERRDDCLNEANHMGALTQARNAQTAEHVATALRANHHIKGYDDV